MTFCIVDYGSESCHNDGLISFQPLTVDCGKREELTIRRDVPDSINCLARIDVQQDDVTQFSRDLVEAI